MSEHKLRICISRSVYVHFLTYPKLWNLVTLNAGTVKFEFPPLTLVTKPTGIHFIPELSVKVANFLILLLYFSHSRFCAIHQLL